MQTRSQSKLNQREMETAESLVSMMRQTTPTDLPIKKRQVISTDVDTTFDKKLVSERHTVWSDDPPPNRSFCNVM